MSASQRVSRGFFRVCLLAPIALLAITPRIAAIAEPMRCEIASKFRCSPAGCKTNELGVFNTFDMETGKFSRCDESGCDEYEATFTRSGTYLVIDVPGRGMVAKLSADDDKYVEITTLGATALVSFGVCSPE